MKPLLYIIIPCYNEESVLPVTSKMFLDELALMSEQGKISPDSRILFVNDGSKDKTWEIISTLSEQDNRFIGISQSRNRGHQNAVLAGLMEAVDHCDITISIDCDGQDDIHAMEEMVDSYMNGAEIVYGVRNSRETDTFFKRFSAQSFYRLLSLMGVESIYNHADYRLISNRVLREFAKFKEVNLFLRGMMPLVGFNSSCVYYARKERIAGESHYPLSKMLGLAFDGITSLSIRPIRMISLLGTILAFIGLIGLTLSAVAMSPELTLYVLWLVCLIGGVQVLCLGVVGEYVGKAYLETKRRPRYIISARTKKERLEMNGNEYIGK